MYPARQIAAPMNRTGAPPVRLCALPASGEIQAFDHPGQSVPAQLAQDWIDLAADASEANVFAEHWFVAAALATLGAGAEISILEVRRGAGLIGVIPVSVVRDYGRNPVRFVQNWCHHQLFLGTPLVRSGEEPAFWTGVLDLLDAADWAPNFLHLRCIGADGPVHRGLVAAAQARGRSAPIVHRESRAWLQSTLDAQAYYEQAVRPKKRKEIRRLRNRLGELGRIEMRALESAGVLDMWCDEFLALERAGWKGREGSALACAPPTAQFFRELLGAAWQAGALQFLRLDLDGRPIAMLVNLLSPPGSFSFKTAFDENYAQFSPGVLIQLENLKILERGDVAWMDSCASENHPMIDSLWRERREVVRITIRLRGARRLMVFAASRALEIAWRSLRRISGKAR